MTSPLVAVFTLTSTSPVVGLAGAFTVTWLELWKVKPGATTPPKVTVELGSKFVPRNTTWPPVIDDWFGVIDDVMRPEVFHPVLRFRPRGGGDDSEVGERPGNLDGDRADAAGAADDQDGARRARNRILYL